MRFEIGAKEVEVESSPDPKVVRDRFCQAGLLGGIGWVMIVYLGICK